MIQNISFLNKQGVQLDGTIRRPSKDGKLPCIIVLHGFSQTQGHDLISELSNELGFYFVTLRFDFHGHGKSFGRNKDHTLTEQIRDVKSVLDEITKLPFVDAMNIYLLGHGLGGNVAIEAGQDIRVKGIIIQGAHSHLEKHSRLQEHYINDLEKTYMEDLRSHHVQEEAQQLNKKCLLIHGNNDFRVTRSEARELFGWLPQGEWLEFDEADHWFREAREELFESILNWVNTN